MTVVNATNARSDPYSLLDRVLEQELVTITTKKGNAVLMSEEEWESIKETLYLMGDPDFLKDVEESRNAPDSDFEAWNRCIRSFSPRKLRKISSGSKGPDRKRRLSRYSRN